MEIPMYIRRKGPKVIVYERNGMFEMSDAEKIALINRSDVFVEEYVKGREYTHAMNINSWFESFDKEFYDKYRLLFNQV